MAGRRLDNVFIERLWKSVKYEKIYPKADDSLAAARQELRVTRHGGSQLCGITYLIFVNGHGHRRLVGITKDEQYHYYPQVI